MAAKINDGLFIGDFDTSQDVEFLELNKISSLINLAGKQLPNIFASHGIVYMTVDWEDREDFELFPSSSGVSVCGLVKEMAVFIDKCQRHGTSVLLFSVNGTGRCAAAAASYLMFKYGWGFEKAYDFLFSKKPDIDLNRGFVEQLFKLDKELRRLKYHSMHNISPLENERLSGWNIDYVFAGLGEEPSTNAKALAEEETLMVNSYNNSKLTITSLPGPYENAMRQFKDFKLQFNLRRNQEAGVHLQRTQPMSPSYKPPRGGILKGGATHISRSSRGAVSQSPPKVQQGRNNSNSLQILENSSDDENDLAFRGNRGQQSGHQRPHEEKKISHECQDDSLLFGGSISLLSAGKETEGYSSTNRDQLLNQSDSLDYFYQRNFQPQESMQSQNSQGSDLYDFVGLQSSSKTSSNYMDMLSLDSHEGDSAPSHPLRRREAKDSSRKVKPSASYTSGGLQDRKVRRSEAKQQSSQQFTPASRRTGDATPEERLHSLLGDLQRGGSKNATEVGGARSNRDIEMYESHSKRNADRGHRPEAKRAHRSQVNSRDSTTVHDVANMNIQPAYYGGISVSGKPVVAMPHTTAWGERSTPSERSRVQDEKRKKTASAKQYRSNTAGNTYRYGSPAPQVPAGGLSGRVRQSSTERERSGSGQQSYNLRRNNSEDEREQGGTRRSTPTRVSGRQRDTPGGGHTATSARRHGTPVRQREKENDRHSTPSRQKSERSTTPARQRPMTPDRTRGWKY